MSEMKPANVSASLLSPIALPLFASNSPKSRRAGLVVAALAALLAIVVVDPAAVGGNRELKRDNSVLPPSAGVPLMAIVALGEQRVTIYDAEGQILRAPVSSGQTGYETPAGIYSILQKQAEHFSNVYENAPMPFMQRITWSGIAFHGGVLPGHPASHGCVRLPMGFAQRLFDLTKIGMRVIVVPTDVTPVDIAHPALFKSRPIAGEVSLATQPGEGQPMPLGAGASHGAMPAPLILAKRLETLKSIVAAKAAEAEAAAKKADTAKARAAKATREAARLAWAQRRAEAVKQRADAQLKSAAEALASPEAMAINAAAAKIKAEVKVAEAQTQLEEANAAAASMTEVAARLREDAKSAEVAKAAAANAAKEAAVKLSPVSVFVSRQSQRLYVRQGFQAIYDSPVTIKDADKSIGTHIYTALEYASDGIDLRWSVVSMTRSQDRHVSEYDMRSRDSVSYSYSGRVRSDDRNGPAIPTDVKSAKLALDRVSIPQDIIDRITEIVLPGSSLIISDEGMSKETGKGTDFVVLMSDELQGGLKIRQRPRLWRRDNDRPYGRNPYFWW
jgi:hypothetical protein